jgi:hypothetical protein
MMMLGVISTIVVSQLWINVETEPLLVIKKTQQRIVWGRIVHHALATKRTPQRIVQAILKTTQQRIMSRTMMML